MGLGDILSLICRYYLFHFDTAKMPLEKLDTAKVVLKYWCGFEALKENEPDLIANWIKAFPNGNGVFKRIVKLSEDEWNGYAKERTKKLNNPAYTSSTVTYESAISSALVQGNLKNRDLVYKTEVLKSILPKDIRSKEKFLQLLATCLVYMEFSPGQKTIAISKQRLQMWRKVNPQNDNVWLSQVKYEDRPIFTKVVVEYITKLSVDEKFLADSGAKLIEHDSFVEDGYSCFTVSDAYRIS